MHLRAQRAYQSLIASQSQKEAYIVGLAPLHDGLAAKPRITPDVDSCPGPVTANLRDDALKLFRAARRGVLIRCPQPCAQQMLATEDVQRQIAVVTVVAMEEPPFLVPVQPVVGCIQVQPYLARRPTIRFHKELDQQLIEGPRTRGDTLVAIVGRCLRVAEFHAVQGTRTRQGIAAVTLTEALVTRHIPLADQQRQDCITPQVAVVTQVFVAQGDGIEALRHQIPDAVFDARRVAMIEPTPCHPAPSGRYACRPPAKRTPPASELIRPPSNRPLTKRRPKV